MKGTLRDFNFPLSCSGTYYPSSTEIQVIFHALLPRGPSGEGAAYNGLYGEAPPKKATFFPCGVLPLMAYTIKVEKKFYFWDWFLIKRQCIYSRYKDAKFLTRYVKGVPFVNRRYTKGVPFSWKLVYIRVKGLHLGAEPPRTNICWVPAPPPGLFQASGMWKTGEITCWSIWKGTEICHFGL